jgi:hypothetical protein
MLASHCWLLMWDCSRSKPSPTPAPLARRALPRRQGAAQGGLLALGRHCQAHCPGQRLPGHLAQAALCAWHQPQPLQRQRSSRCCSGWRAGSKGSRGGGAGSRGGAAAAAGGGSSRGDSTAGSSGAGGRAGGVPLSGHPLPLHPHRPAAQGCPGTGQLLQQLAVLGRPDYRSAAAPAAAHSRRGHRAGGCCGGDSGGGCVRSSSNGS